MRVSRLFTTTLKGSALKSPSSLDVDRHGVVGDRRFFLVDPHSSIVSCKTCGELFFIYADFDPQSDMLTLTFPSGNVLRGNVAERGEELAVDFFGE